MKKEISIDLVNGRIKDIKTINKLEGLNENNGQQTMDINVAIQKYLKDIEDVNKKT